MPAHIDQPHRHQQQIGGQADRQPDKPQRPDRRLLWVGVSVGASMLGAAALWTLAIIAASGGFGVPDRASDMLTGAAVTVTVLAGQLVLDYRRQAHTGAAHADLAQAIQALTEKVARQHRESLETMRTVAAEATEAMNQAAWKGFAQGLRENLDPQDSAKVVTMPRQSKPANGQGIGHPS